MMLKRFFLFIMILSVFSISQRGILGSFNLKSLNETTEATEHFHEHSFLSEINFFVLGFLTHTHEHTHDDADSHETHDSNTHSHTETSQIKTFFIASQNCFLFSDIFKSIFGASILNLHNYDHPFQIFRPPIFA